VASAAAGQGGQRPPRLSMAKASSAWGT
jgi:hypothetical protein